MKNISIGHVDLAYYDTLQGESWKGNIPQVNPLTTLLMVHGFPLSHAMWRPVIEELEKTKRCRIIAPDLAGYGESTSATLPTSLSEYADDLALLLDTLSIKEPVVYVGFSMGGYILWPFLMRYANKLKGIALVDTRAADDSDEARATRLKMARNVEQWGTERVTQLMRPNLFSAENMDSEVVDKTLQVITSTDPKTIAASQLAMAARPDSTSLLADIKVPTEVVVGESDQISTVAEMRMIADAIAGAEFTVIEKAGHMTPVERPVELAAALLKLVDRVAIS